MQIHVRVKPKSAPDALHVGRIAVRIPSRPLRVLDFDLENRPLSYLGADFTTAEVTALAWAWTDAPQKVTVRLLGDTSLDSILREFVRAYDEADMVTGHFIKGHDLPMLNGALTELGMPPLGDKLAQDTKLDLLRMKGISRSQESLAAMFGLSHPKVQMNQAKWREANRLTKAGRAYVRERVGGDVQQHIELRQHLLERGLLREPKIWRSQRSRIAQYAP